MFKNLIEYIGIEPGRVHFSWVSSAEATKFVDVVNEVVDAVKELGPNKYYVKKDLTEVLPA